jgi:hypothetical protein
MADQNPAVAEDAPNTAPNTADDDREFAIAGRAQDAIQASLLVAALEEAGIDAFTDADRDGMVEKLSAPAEGFPIKVPRADLEKATALVAEQKAALEADPAGGARAAEEASAAEEAASAAKVGAGG